MLLKRLITIGGLAAVVHAAPGRLEEDCAAAAPERGSVLLQRRTEDRVGFVTASEEEAESGVVALDEAEDEMEGEAEDEEETGDATQGLAWTVREARITKKRIAKLFDRSAVASHNWGVKPGTVLRLSFHDCLRYEDGTGGCDGCLNWQGVDVRLVSKSSMASNGDNDAPDLKDGDGGNNALGDAVRELEKIYADQRITRGKSLKGNGRSRADFWALAGIVAVEYTMDINNDVCERGTTPAKQTKAQKGQCLHAQGEPNCKVTPSRRLLFKYGRKDCQTDLSPSYKASKHEKHPSAHMNGPQITQFMKEEFGFSGKETVAIMGAHTIGVYHPSMTGFKYVWTPRNELSFNNEYYRNMINEDSWQFDNDLCTKVGDAWGEKGKGAWVVKANAFTVNIGPIQWIQMKHICPTCEMRNPTDVPWRKNMELDCCTQNVPEGAFCRPDNGREKGSDALTADDDLNDGCEQWKFLWGRDHAMLNTDMGLYLNFSVDEYGFPQDCPGLENFNKDTVRKKNAWPEGWQTCDVQKHAEPAGSKPLYEWVEEFARDQTSWIDAYIPAMEKYLDSGYADGELTPMDDRE